MSILLVCLAYLIGSFPTGVLLSRLLIGRDVREFGSGNVGAANVARLAGLKIGVFVAVLDILKGALPVLLGLAASLDHTALALVGLAAVFGHDFSLFLRFRGGKGVATTIGVALLLVPLATAIALLIWIASFAVSRYSSLASLVALAWLPLGATATGRPAAYVWLMLGLLVLGAAKHWENMLRLLNGTERKFWGARPADGA